MGRIWRTWLLVLALTHSTRTLETSYLTKILTEPILIKNNFAECLLRILRDPSLDFMVNIGIYIEAESALSRKEFTYTIERFIALNDRVTMYLGSVEGDNIHGRIYFVDSLKSLEVLIKRHRKGDNDHSGERQYYLIILPVNVKKPNRLMKQIFHLCWNESIVNVNILVGDKYGVISLYTYFPYTAKSCADYTPIIHNRFTNGGFVSNKSIFPPKTSNLWQCPVRVPLHHIPPYIILNQTQVAGFGADNILTLAESMNFSYTNVMSLGGLGQVYSSTNSTGIFKMANDELIDLFIAVGTEIGFKNFATTNVAYFFYLRLVIKRIKGFGHLELLLQPFDWYTWIGLSTLFVVKWIVHLLWRRFRNRSIAPSEIFSRFSTMFWLFLMLIASSSYQGLIFKFLNSPPNEALPKTIDEAIDQDYKFVASSFHVHHLLRIPELKNRIIKYGDSETETLKFFDRLEGKYGYAVWEHLIPVTIDSKKYEEFYIVPERIADYSIYYHMRKFSHLTVEVSKHVQQMHVYGHFLKNYKKNVLKMEFQTKKTNIGPESMSLQQLNGAFKLFNILIVISACVFLMELLATYNRRLRVVLEVFQ